jgi:hypothetical protein
LAFDLARLESERVEAWRILGLRDLVERLLDDSARNSMQQAADVARTDADAESAVRAVAQYHDDVRTLAFVEELVLHVDLLGIE